MAGWRNPVGFRNYNRCVIIRSKIRSSKNKKICNIMQKKLSYKVKEPYIRELRMGVGL